MITKEDSRDIFSKAYAKSALQENYDMRLVADLYESLRPQMTRFPPSDVWDNISLDRIKFDNDICNQLLVGLRDDFFKAFIQNQVDLLNKAISHNPDKLIDLWNQFYADAAIHFKEDFIYILCQQRLKWDKSANRIKKYERLTRIIQENRWPDAYPIYKEIAENSKLETKIRVCAEVILEEIILYYYPQGFTGAKNHLENANKLLPDYFITKRGWGEYYLKTGDFKKARNSFLQVTIDQPTDYLAFNYLGDCFQAEGDLESAESSFIDALHRNFLQTESFKRLINLYADKKWFLEKQDQINALLMKISERAGFPTRVELTKKNSLAPDYFIDLGLYHSYRDVGAAWFANEDLKKAEEWYLKAFHLQPAFAPAIIDIAYLKIYQKKHQKAKDYFLKALEQDPENFEIYWGLAYYYEQQSEKEEALKAYQQCLRLRPHWNDWVNNSIGNIYYSSKDYEKAASYYRKSIKANNDYPIYKQNLADALQLIADELVKQDSKEAIKKAKKIYRTAASMANTASAWNVLGNFYYKTENWQQAIDSYDKAINLNNTEPVYYENRGLAYERLNDVEKVEESYTKAIEADTQTGKYFNRLGLFYYKRKEYDKAIVYYLKALEYEPGNPIVLDNICIAYEQIDQRDKAEPYYLKLLQEEPDNDKVMNMLGVMYYRRGNYEKALLYYDMAIKRNSNEIVYYDNLAILLRTEEKNEEAIKVIETILQLDPTDDKNWNDAGVLYFTNGNYDKALEYYIKSVSLKSDVPVYYENIGLAYEKKELFTEAINNYRIALSLNTNNSRVLNAIGLIFFKQKDYSNAIDYYRKAIEIDKENWIYYTNLGLALYELRFDDEAIKAYEKAVELNKGDYLNWNQLGLLYYQNGNFEKAVEYYNKAIELEKNDMVVYVNLVLALNAEGKTKEALSILATITLPDEVKKQLENLIH